MDGEVADARSGGFRVSPVLVAATMAARAKGLLGTRSFEGALLLVPCRRVHTFGMAYSLDIAFVDRSGKVLRSVRAVGPNRLTGCRGALATIERQHDPCDDWFAQGDTIALAAAERERKRSERMSSVRGYDV